MTKLSYDFGPMSKGRAAYHQSAVPKQILLGGKVSLLSSLLNRDADTIERLDKDAARQSRKYETARRRVRLVAGIQLRFRPPHDHQIW
jgi:hypothetical protein